MNAITRRHRKLETKLVPPVDEEGTRLVEQIRERRRRRLPQRDESPKKTRCRKCWRMAVNRAHLPKPSGASGSESAIDENCPLDSLT
jgi:hypothetical protein